MHNVVAGWLFLKYVRRPWLVALALTLVAAVRPSALAASTPPAIGYNAAARTVTLDLTAGQANGYNFNGYAGGALIVKVPAGATVQVTMRNVAADVSHSVLVARGISARRAAVSPRRSPTRRRRVSIPASPRTIRRCTSGSPPAPPGCTPSSAGFPATR
jgi:hypothetical protein